METKKCPYCAEIIKADAVLCRFCNHQVAVPDSNTAAILRELPTPANLVLEHTPSPNPTPAEELPGSSVLTAAPREAVTVASLPDVPAPTVRPQAESTPRDVPVGMRRTASGLLLPERAMLPDTESRDELPETPFRIGAVFRDVSLIMLAELVGGFLGGFVVGLAMRSSSTPVDSEALRAGSGSAGTIVGTFVSWVMWLVVACWGRQTPGTRRKRLLCDAGIVWIIQVALTVIFRSGVLGVTLFTFTIYYSAIFGITLWLSLKFAPPRWVKPGE